MATGHPPFRAATAMAVLHRICHDTHRPVWQWNKEIPDEVSDTIDRLLEKKPHKRYTNAEEVQQRLAALLSRLQQHGLGRRPLRRWVGRRRRFKLVASIAGVVALTAVALAAFVPRTVTPPNAQPPAATTEAPISQAEFAAVAEMGRQFRNELSTVESELKAASSDYFFVHSLDDPWRRELEALQRDMVQYEAANNTIHPCQGECCEVPKNR
jgi:serine/threonine protein kinase